ncbi:chemotaxis protein CheB [Caballeronia glebae]|uniref:chemotaxis protein CheB n=1 Tax=Caballeronia glebae TaxID=1777143 RepID=UPI0038BB096F
MTVRRDIAVVAASRGGFKALCRLVSSLDAAYEGSLLIVLHSGPTGPRLLSECLQRHTSLDVEYGHQGQSIEPGHIYLAPPGHHLVVSPSGDLALDDGPKVNHVRPAADPLFESAAACFHRRVVGVVLTGGGSDGTRGLQAIEAAGGIGIVQHPAQAEAPQMPMNALNFDSPEQALSLTEIGHLLGSLARQ